MRADLLSPAAVAALVLLTTQADSVVVTSTLLHGESSGLIDKSRDAILKQVAQEMWLNVCETYALSLD